MNGKKNYAMRQKILKLINESALHLIKHFLFKIIFNLKTTTYLYYLRHVFTLLLISLIILTCKIAYHSVSYRIIDIY